MRGSHGVARSVRERAATSMERHWEQLGRCGGGRLRKHGSGLRHLRPDRHSQSKLVVYRAVLIQSSAPRSRSRRRRRPLRAAQVSPPFSPRIIGIGIELSSESPSLGDAGRSGRRQSWQNVAGTLMSGILGVSGDGAWGCEAGALQVPAWKKGGRNESHPGEEKLVRKRALRALLVDRLRSAEKPVQESNRQGWQTWRAVQLRKTALRGAGRWRRLGIQRSVLCTGAS